MTKCSWRGCQATTEKPTKNGWAQRADIYPDEAYLCSEHSAALAVVFRMDDGADGEALRNRSS
jgi:hypothetical protein